MLVNWDTEKVIWDRLFSSDVMKERRSCLQVAVMS